jgi:NTE family protein
MHDIPVGIRAKSQRPGHSPERYWRPERCDRIALVLQGGGALGAYQAGVYQAMHEAGVEPDWVSGVSIGAINSAIIAGNPPGRRLRQLRAFWEMITDRKIWPFTPDGDLYPQGSERCEFFRDHDRGTARLLRAAFSQSVDEPVRRYLGNELL